MGGGGGGGGRSENKTPQPASKVSHTECLAGLLGFVSMPVCAPFFCVCVGVAVSISCPSRLRSLAEWSLKPTVAFCMRTWRGFPGGGKGQNFSKQGVRS